MAIKRIPPNAIHKGQPYRDGEIITGTMVNEVVKVLKDGVNYNKFFIDAMFAGTTEEAIVIGVDSLTGDPVVNDITQLNNFITVEGITVANGDKAFVFRCIYGNVYDPTEITGIQALNYYKYVTNAWVHQYAVSIDNFIKGLSSDFADYDEVTTLADDDLFVIKDVSDNKPVVITKESLKETIGVNDVNQRVDGLLDGTTTVKKAEQDKNGNDIFDTYETKSDATSKLALKADKTYVDAQDQALDDYFESEITKIKDGTTIVKKAEQDKNGNTIDLTYATKTENNQKADKTYVDNEIDIIEVALASKEVIANKGQPNGYAPVGADGYIPSAFIPNSFDDVLEFDTYASLLAYATPDTSKLYIVKSDETSGGNHSTYRYTGTIYVRVSDEMSASEIKALYESNANTNAFTDALKNKLDGLLNGSQYYDKTYIDSLEENMNGWTKTLLTPTGMSRNDTIPLADLTSKDKLLFVCKKHYTDGYAFVQVDTEELSGSDLVSNLVVRFFETDPSLISGLFPGLLIDYPVGYASFYEESPDNTNYYYKLWIYGYTATEQTAGNITYDNTESGMTATNVQGALDEVEARVDTLETFKNTTVPATYETKEDATEKFNTLDVKKANRYIDEPIAELNGHTLREVFEGGNVILNSDFSNGNTGWEVVGAGATLNIVGGVAQVTRTTGALAIRQTSNNLVSGSKYYFKILNITTDMTEFYIYRSGTANFIRIDNTNFSGILTATFNGRSSFGQEVYLNGTYYNIDNIFGIDLTSLGISSLTVSRMDYWFNVWQQYKDDNGLKSTVDGLQALKEKDSEIELKVTTIEEAYRKSQNGELTATKFDTDNISLGKDVAPAPLQVKVDGGLLEAKQLVVNGDFSIDSNSDDIPDGSSYTDTTIYSLENGIVSFTPTSSTSKFRSPSVTTISGNRYYYGVIVKSDNTGTLFNVSNAHANIAHSGSGKYEILSQVVTAYYALSRNDVFTNLSSGWTEIKVSQSFTFNISTLIANKTYSPLYNKTFDLMSDAEIKAQMDLWVQNGTLPNDNVLAVGMNKRVRSVGKNLFDGVWESGWINTLDGTNNDLLSTRLRSDFIKIKNVAHIISTSNAISTFNVYYYNFNYTYISSQSYNLVSNVTITVPNGAVYIRFAEATGNAKNYNIQLELGSTATSYVPYANTDLYLQPNKVGYRRYDGILDYINYRNGKYYFNQFLSRVSNIDTPVQELNNKTLREVFEGGNVIINGDFNNGSTNWGTSFGTTLNVVNGVAQITRNDGTLVLRQNVDNLTINSKYYIKIVNLITDMSDFYIYRSGTANFLRLDDKNFSALFTSTGNGKTLFGRELYIDGTYFYIDNIYSIDMTTLGISSLTVSQMDYWFNEYTKLVASTPTIALDKLATPIETEILALGNAQGLAGGTVYIDDIMADSNLYTSKYDIENTAYPIKSLDRIVKINADGSQTELAVSSAVVAGDGLSFTHPSLVANDIVWIAYTYNVANLFKSNTFVTYYDNPFIAVQPNGTPRRITFSVDNSGVVTVSSVAV